MKALPLQSISSSLKIKDSTIYVRRRHHVGYHRGVNKPNEYSWFYIVALTGQQGEPVTLFANMSKSEIPQLTRSNSLLFYSTDQINWHQFKQSVWTDSAGLKQYATFHLPVSGNLFISNTIFYDYHYLRRYFSSYVQRHSNLCYQISLGQSLLKQPLNMITFAVAPQPRGRILITTGCHPAEPDVIASQAILDWLATPAATPLLKHYHIDILPLSNPDGYINKSCLTNNGINLYWNFLLDDQVNCPEAYYLWRYLKKNPPLLYLDFHSYVHQYHRHPMPYLKEPGAYLGTATKAVVKKMDRLLIKQSGGYYRFGQLAMWPDALSSFITKRFNTIAYTKYHFNLYEGIPACRHRALTIFTGLTNILLQHKVDQRLILRAPYGHAQPDRSDRFPRSAYYQFMNLYRQSFIYAKSYWRYYRHRNKDNLFPSPTKISAPNKSSHPPNS